MLIYGFHSSLRIGRSRAHQVAISVARYTSSNFRDLCIACLKTFICMLIKTVKIEGEKLRRIFPAILLIVMFGLMLSQTFLAKSSLPGDLNDDGVVDLKDLSILAQAYGSTPTSPNWNEKADLAEPLGLISLTDLVTLSYYYSQH